MQRIGRTRYTTGAFAKLFGINKDTLLYYDKINLFKPAIVGENDYRYYDASQIEVFWVSMGYEVNGDIFEEYTIGQVATKQVEQYVTKLYIPVKRSDKHSV